MIKKKLPSKVKDPRSFSIPCVIGNMRFDRALGDLREVYISLMTLSIYEKLGRGEMKPTISLCN